MAAWAKISRSGCPADLLFACEDQFGALNRAGRYLDRSAERDKCHAWVGGRKDVVTRTVSAPSGHGGNLAIKGR